MITAQQAKTLAGTEKLDKIRKDWERRIQQAAQNGDHCCLLDYCHTCNGNHHLILEELKQKGFHIYEQSETCGGVLQYRGYYARW